MCSTRSLREKAVRLKKLFREFDQLSTSLQNKIRELPHHHHVIDKAIENWQHQTFKRFDSLGNSSDVPLFLRANKTILFERKLHEWNHDRTRKVIDDSK